MDNSGRTAAGKFVQKFLSMLDGNFSEDELAALVEQRDKAREASCDETARRLAIEAAELQSRCDRLAELEAAAMAWLCASETLDITDTTENRIAHGITIQELKEAAIALRDSQGKDGGNGNEG